MIAPAGHDAPARAARAAWNALLTLVVVGPAAAGRPQDAVAVDVRIEKTDGTTVSGFLESISEREVRLAAAPVIDVAAVRRLVVVAADGGPPGRVTVMGDAGLRLTGQDFLWQDGAAVIRRDEGRIELPIERIRTVAFRLDRTGVADAEWLAAIPETPGSDLVVVARQQDKDAAGFELVECAITAVGAEQVTVMLDEETIRVNRGKVAGLHWLRQAAGGEAGVAVEVSGGGLRGKTITWTPESLAIDGTVRLPGRLLRGIDYAAGRTVRLATLTAERTTVEPFFGGLTAVGRVGEFFAPRFLSPDAPEERGLLVRPRTVVVWRVPADSRRFRARLADVASNAGGRGAEVSIQADDREVFRSSAADRVGPRREPRTVDVPIDVDVARARRLTITVDAAAAGGPAGPVFFHDPVFEK